MSVNFGLHDAIASVAKNNPAPGLYKLRQMFGEDWTHARRPQHLGRLFKAAVLRGDVPGVRWVRRRSDKSQEYEVLLAVS